MGLYRRLSGLNDNTLITGLNYAPAWGTIVGTLSDQTDLQTALDAKSDTTHNHDTSYAALSHTHEGVTVDSTGAADGEVLTADGSGGVAWEAVVGGGGAGPDFTTDITITKSGPTIKLLDSDSTNENHSFQVDFGTFSIYHTNDTGLLSSPWFTFDPTSNFAFLNCGGDSSTEGLRITGNLFLDDFIESYGGSTPSNGQALIWNSTSTRFEAQDVSAAHPAAITGHVRAGNTQILDGGTTGSSESLTTNSADGVFQTYGPTGSGADNIWSILDNLPSSARILIVDTTLGVEPNGLGAATATVHATSGDVASPSVSEANNRIARFYLDTDTNVSGPSSVGQLAEIPLNSNHVFKAAWTDNNSGNTSAVMYYRGFKTDT